MRVRSIATINIVYALEDSAVAIDGAALPLAADAGAARRRRTGSRLQVERGRVALAMISSRSAP